MAGKTPLAKGNGAAAVGIVTGSIILSGITESDSENGLHASRHGHTLTGIFRAKVDTVLAAADDEGVVTQQTKLFLIFPPVDGLDEDAVKKDVQSVFASVLAEKNVHVDFDSVFEINIAQVANEEDAKKVSFTEELCMKCYCSMNIIGKGSKGKGHIVSKLNSNYMFTNQYFPSRLKFHYTVHTIAHIAL